MTLKIYGIPASRAFRAIWMAEELGLAYENVPYGFKGPEIKQAAYLAINPNGAVPAIDDGGFTLWESMAINLYLARRYDGGRGLWPEGAEAEARLYQWTFWAATEIEPRLGNWYYHSRLLPEAERIPELARRAVAELPRRFSVAEATLKASPCLLGQAFTAADLNVAVTMTRARELGIGDFPALEAWLERCYSRPAAKKALALRAASLEAMAR
jgi:glutathione S-transferase